jgi:ribulose 1,5-bisphosphate synthetase/thiazole synthase
MFNRCAPFEPLKITPYDFLRSGEMESEVTEIAEYDIAIIGAGVAGLYTVA